MCEEILHRFNRRHRADSREEAMVQIASVQPTIAHWINRQNPKRTPVQLSRETSKWTNEHRLIRRVQLQCAGAVVQRSGKMNPTMHRMNRRYEFSIRRSNELNSTWGKLVRLHRSNRCPWIAKAPVQQTNQQKTLMHE